ncbi:hypothetical protein DUNSADRAFT_14447 [Dunaliella salina]|uniref:Uncharacterized protein n=1 Tax=Dunaliella salina TaxID=3046 RepID=A0ABQ7H9K3_DUNSA|nr:hypothetical protein DUNSADRAFT_14447 [Dunaliella salina]|eukprot:KAF5843531.1 hypothetical protein DUNSADRAFT_14447 [Dunaliella salina]
MLKAHRAHLLCQKAPCRPVLPSVYPPRKPAFALRSLGSSRGNGSSRSWDAGDHWSNRSRDGEADGSVEEIGLNSGSEDRFFSSSSSSSTSSTSSSTSSSGSGGGNGGCNSDEDRPDRERVESSGSGSGEHSIRGSGSSRDWLLASGSNSVSSSSGRNGSGTDWDQSWKDWVWQNSSGSEGSSKAPESPTRGGGSNRVGYDSFMTSTGVSWAPSTGYNINSYTRMNEERLEGLQWLARYLAGKRQKGWLWNNEAKAFAELRRRGIECCAHHGEALTNVQGNHSLCRIHQDQM